MKQDVAEGEQADRPAQADQARLFENPGQRRDGQADDQHPQAPDAQLADKRLDRIGAQIALVCPPAQPQQRQQAGQRDRPQGDRVHGLAAHQ